jgi:DNA-directed RNA polymerase subunit RPC12/RpoP
MVDAICPDCGLEMEQIEKTTFTGRDMREYQCRKCGRTEIIDRGKALWEILSEANEESGKD